MSVCTTKSTIYGYYIQIVVAVIVVVVYISIAFEYLPFKHIIRDCRSAVCISKLGGPDGRRKHMGDTVSSFFFFGKTTR